MLVFRGVNFRITNFWLKLESYKAPFHMSNDRKIAWDIEQQEIKSDVPYANYHWIQSLKPTQPLEKVHHKRNFILQPWIFRSYVSFKEGTCICLATLGHVSSWIHTTRTWKGLVWSSFGVNDILLKGTCQNNCKLKNGTSQYSCQIYLWVNSQTSPTSKFDGKKQLNSFFAAVFKV